MDINNEGRRGALLGLRRPPEFAKKITKPLF
jgi:hypothetical protein